jgi:Ca2+-binding EF-hand superfamily protein
MREFESDRRTLELMFRLIKPENITEPDYIIFKVLHRLSKLGKDVETLFQQIDTDHDGQITRDEFLHGAKYAIEMPISKVDLGKAFDYVDTNSDDTISREEFTAAVNFTAF